VNDKPRLLVISAVLPFPRETGQQQRVHYTLQALRGNFHVTFLTVSDADRMGETRQKLLETCDEAIVLPSLYSRSMASRLIYKIIGSLYAAWSGLKFSNYLIGKLEFSPARLQAVVSGLSFDVILFEYWHAHESAKLFRAREIKTVLDMHDILWQSYTRQLEVRRLPDWVKRVWAGRYRVREEAAWRDFDTLVAINQAEYEYVRAKTSRDVMYVPMGIDLSAWQYSWSPATPKRVAYYGGLGSRHNQQDALTCYREIMPRIWEKFPDVEFWIVGSNPSAFIKELERDPRAHVTGFVERPQDILRTMSLVLCPWSGTYGFRSRIVEVMALGVPVVASVDAVDGMGFKVDQGIALGKSVSDLAAFGLNWLGNDAELVRQSRMARGEVESCFSYEATYLRFSNALRGMSVLS